MLIINPRHTIWRGFYLFFTPTILHLNQYMPIMATVIDNNRQRKQKNEQPLQRSRLDETARFAQRR